MKLQELIKQLQRAAALLGTDDVEVTAARRWVVEIEAVEVRQGKVILHIGSPEVK